MAAASSYDDVSLQCADADRSSINRHSNGRVLSNRCLDTNYSVIGPSSDFRVVAKCAKIVSFIAAAAVYRKIRVLSNRCLVTVPDGCVYLRLLRPVDGAKSVQRAADAGLQQLVRQSRRICRHVETVQKIAASGKTRGCAWA